MSNFAYSVRITDTDTLAQATTKANTMLSELKAFVEATGSTKLTGPNLQPYAGLRTDQFAPNTIQTAQFGAAVLGRGIYGDNIQTSKTIQKAKFVGSTLRDYNFGKTVGGYGIYCDAAPTVKWGLIVGLKTFTVTSGTSTGTVTVTYNSDADNVAGSVVSIFGSTWTNIRVLWWPVATGVLEQWLSGSAPVRKMSMRIIKSTVSATAFNVTYQRRNPTTDATLNAPADETYAFKWRISFKYS